jgi:hypothetical protein
MVIRSKGGVNISPALRRSLNGLDSLPNVREVVLDRSFSNGTHEVGFDVKHYDPAKQGIRVTIHAKNGIGQHVYVKADKIYESELKRAIEEMNARKDEYFS